MNDTAQLVLPRAAGRASSTDSTSMTKAMTEIPKRGVCAAPRVTRRGRKPCRRARTGALLLTAFALLACDLAREVTPDDPLSVGRVAIVPSDNMVTAVTVAVECSGAVSAIEVDYTATGIDSGSTPRTAVAGCPTSVHVLGLLERTTYHTTIKLWGSGDSIRVVGPTLPIDSLPADLPHLSAALTAGVSRGMTAFAIIDPSRLDQGLALVVDSIGRIRWYLRSSRLITDFQPQASDRYTIALANYEPLAFSVLGYLAGEYQELDVAGALRNKWTATGGYSTDNHDIRLTTKGTAVLLGFDLRAMDLTSLGLSSSTEVLGNVLQEVDSAGRLLFSWNAFDHFTLADVDPAVIPLISLSPSRLDWTHANAVDVDQDGNYLVSFRHLSEVTKIDSRNGAVLWRLGGVRNDFMFDSDSNEFSFQHGVRRLPTGSLIMFDNGNRHTPPFSRAIEYRLNEQTRTAQAVWQYRPTPDLFSFALGFAERLGNGNTLVTFGTSAIVQEVSPAAKLVWQVSVPAGLFVYRAYRLRSLYEISDN